MHTDSFSLIFVSVINCCGHVWIDGSGACHKAKKLRKEMNGNTEILPLESLSGVIFHAL